MRSRRSSTSMLEKCTLGGLLFTKSSPQKWRWTVSFSPWPRAPGGEHLFPTFSLARSTSFSSMAPRTRYPISIRALQPNRVPVMPFQIFAVFAFNMLMTFEGSSLLVLSRLTRLDVVHVWCQRMDWSLVSQETNRFQLWRSAQVGVSTFSGTITGTSTATDDTAGMLLPQSK